MMPAYAEQAKELKTNIDHVTVYLQGAQITRTGEYILKPGRTALQIKALSPHLDAKGSSGSATKDQALCRTGSATDAGQAAYL